MVDSPLDEQNVWGGPVFPPHLPVDTGGQTFLPSHPAADTVPSQVPFTASASDDLFAPVSGGPSFSHPYTLPSVPDPSLFHCRSQRPHTLSHPAPSFRYPLFPPSYVSRPPLPPLPPPPLPHISTRPIRSPPLYPLPDEHIPHSFPHTFPPQSSLPQPYLPYPSHPHFPPQHPHHYQPPPIQYVYLPSPSSDTSHLPPSSKSLPVITTIHTLNSKTDFFAWDEGVCTLLRLLGIHGHIVDPALPVDPL